MSDSSVRVIIDTTPHSGQWNMACDETLLISACDNNLCTFRWYLWEEATLSLGYFQKVEPSFFKNDRWATLPKVKRLSGGGAILHHHEITYSCALPATHPLAENPAKLYQKIHEQIIATLKKEGIQLHLRGEGKVTPHDPFLCFQRGDANDVIFEKHKVLGSAQRRRRGALLQHGSLLLSKSKWAPEIPGILDLVSLGFDSHKLLEKLAQATVPILGEPDFEQPVTEKEKNCINHLIESRYRHLNWSSKKQKT
ncbi:Lipoate-protein ligase A [hydrothermal vent metagenome]|uniref:Lipoate-protein ligase A n=1 Tax=hydrothermal vent metagenome TaxID=652676 RepID=A0A3B1E210_9ZZZZ